jgi:dihydroorotate dehydrogenase
MNSTISGNLIKVSKISPYGRLPPSDEEIESKMKSIQVFYENGGDAVTIGNTRPINTRQVPKAMRFAREVAGESGRPLFPYMLKMLKDARKRFPDLSIIACGGIFDGEDAWRAYENGANLVELYTALTFRGFGVVRQIHDTLKKKLGTRTLQDFIEVGGVRNKEEKV